MHLDLGFRAFDPHELLPHALAARLGLYDDNGVTVRLVDLTFSPDLDVQVSLGSALLARLAGADLRIALVASRHPLFWVYGRERRDPTDPLRVAGYPDGTPPAVFTRVVLPHAELVPARDSDTRLGLLLTGQVDAAVVSTAVPPDSLDRRGLHRLVALPEHLTVPTTGLAAPVPLLDTPPLTAATTALQTALRVMHDDPDTVARTLVDVFRYDRTSAERAAAEYAGWYSPDGTVSTAEAAAALGTLADTTGTDAPAVDAVFADTSLRRGSHRDGSSGDDASHG